MDPNIKKTKDELFGFSCNKYELTGLAVGFCLPLSFKHLPQRAV
jgi:hypothetical protein